MSEPSQTGVGTRPVRAAAEPGVPRTRRSGPVLTSGMPTFDEGVLRRQRDMYADAVPEVRRVVARLLADADDSLRRPVYHVTAKTGCAPSGDPHDYWSVAPYWWPNPDSPDGLPYLRRDGHRAPGTGLWEPGSEQYDRSALQSMIDETTVLALAGYLTREAKYFARARALLRAWFIDPDTRMNPHLRYAQVRRGHDGDEGTASGIIDAKDLYYLLDAARLLETEEALPPREAEALREWFDQFRCWLLTSDQGRAACASVNNRGTWYDVLVAAISGYLSDVRGVLRILRRVPARMAAQIAPDGSQPLELERTLPAHYCAYNLQGWVALGYIARGVGAEIWSYRPPSGPGVADACRWILRADHEWTDARRAEDFDDERLAVLAHEAALMDPSTDLVDALRPDQRGPWSVRQRFTATEGIRPYWLLARREAREPVEINLADIVRKRAAAAPATRHADVDQNGFDAREGDAAPAPADGRRPPSRDRGVVAAISQKVLRNRDAVMYLALGLTYRQERFDEVVGMIDDFVRPPTKEEDAPLPLREALVESVRETLAAVGFPDVRIGITGGMDSRLLYAALRQIYEPDRITPYTFGYPGQYDYEFVKRYGGRFLHNHVMLDTREIRWSLSDEVKKRRKLGNPGTYNSKSILYRALTDRGVPEHNFHGFMGDSLTGATKPDRHRRVESWDDAVQRFLKKNDRFNLQRYLADAGDLRALLPKPPSVAVKNVDYYDLLDFGIRQFQRILRDTGRLSTTLVPYTNRKWISALVATGDSSARERAYYRLAAKEFATYFPELSEYSITSRDEHVKFRENLMKSVLPTLGRLRNDDGSPYTPQVTSDAGRVLPGRQFCEFAEYHNNPSFRRFFDELYESLRARNLFSPSFLEDVRQRFLGASKLATEQIRGLVSFELNLQAGTIVL